MIRIQNGVELKNKKILSFNFDFKKNILTSNTGTHPSSEINQLDTFLLIIKIIINYN